MKKFIFKNPEKFSLEKFTSLNWWIIKSPWITLVTALLGILILATWLENKYSLLHYILN